MAINPISIPDGAGIDYANSDVRHISAGDGINVPALSAPTRQLAHRDKAIADKLNEVIEHVNQREQIISIPVVRTTLPPAESVVVANYRIPPGYEARVLNAVVSTTPTGLGKLEIFHSENFGDNSGTSLVTTLSEFPGATDAPTGTDFRPTGELVVKLTNVGSVGAETVASVLVTLRAVGETGALIAAGSTAARGERGLQGPPGLIWRDHWQNGVDYVKNDGVYSSVTGNSYICRVATSSVNPDSDAGTELDGVGTNWAILAKSGAGAPINGNDGKDGPTWSGAWTDSHGVYNDGASTAADLVSYSGSAYICIQTHTAAADKTPGTVGGAAYWDLFAAAGVDGNAADSVIYKGAWNPIDQYEKGYMVTHTQAGQPARTWVANGHVNPNLEPGVSALWDELFGPSPAAPVLSSVSSNGTIEAGVGYTAGVTSQGYSGVDLTSPVSFAYAQKKISTSSTTAFATLVAAGRMIFKGTARFKLPAPADGALGASKPWDASNTVLFATLHGKSTVESGDAKLVVVTSGVDAGTTYFDVTVNCAVAEKVLISVFGSEVLTA